MRNGDKIQYLEEYLVDLLGSFVRTDLERVETKGLEAIVEKVFDSLIARPFCYLSKSRAMPYRETVTNWVRKAVLEDKPISFFYDIGGGYHAAVFPGEGDLCFEVGLAELFILSQIARFCRRIEEFYPKGAVFHLVIDNLCAHMINDIPLEKTNRYCTDLRMLIHETGMDQRVGLVVESEHFSPNDYRAGRVVFPTEVDLLNLTSKEHENVSRFLGRSCNLDEACEYFRRYKNTIATSEYLLTPIVQGVHMTQRATANTICFRPFPGADSRMQCGEVVIGRNNKDKLYPFLMTSRNADGFILTHYHFSDLLPKPVRRVTYAERRGIQHGV